MTKINFKNKNAALSYSGATYGFPEGYLLSDNGLLFLKTKNGIVNVTTKSGHCDVGSYWYNSYDWTMNFTPVSEITITIP